MTYNLVRHPRLQRLDKIALISTCCNKDRRFRNAVLSHPNDVESGQVSNLEIKKETTRKKGEWKGNEEKRKAEERQNYLLSESYAASQAGGKFPSRNVNSTAVRQSEIGFDGICGSGQNGTVKSGGVEKQEWTYRHDVAGVDNAGVD